MYLVTIARTKYLLDGGFGPQGPPRPISVLDGLESFQIEPDQMRVFMNLFQNFRPKSACVGVSIPSREKWRLDNDVLFYRL